MKKRKTLSIERVVSKTVALLKNQFEDRIKLWGHDLDQSEVREVIGSLLARQISIAIQLVSSPGMWNGHVAPLFLRAMADVHIILVWVQKDPESRARLFIRYGLGQQKLELEHRRAEMASRSPLKGEGEYIIAMESWIDRQRINYLVEVNVGSWSGKTTREMAEEAECLDFYNYVYSPFSACVHSSWHHISKYNLRVCENPLHRFHSVPYLATAPFDPDYLFLAAKYAEKSFGAFDSFTSVKSKTESALGWLQEVL